MKIKRDRLGSAIWMFNHYKGLAYKCWDIYTDISDACYMFDYYMEMAETYRELILKLI
jgi:hypothetical protein